jgi:hypothetical protein
VRNTPGSLLAALIERGVDVGCPTGNMRGHRVAHGGDVPPDDRLDCSVTDQLVDLIGHCCRVAASVDLHEPQLTGEDAALGVDLLGGQPSQCSQDAPAEPWRGTTSATSKVCRAPVRLGVLRCNVLPPSLGSSAETLSGKVFLVWSIPTVASAASVRNG